MADREVAVAGDVAMPGSPDPMTSATEAMRRIALKRPTAGEMPTGGMPEHQVEDEGGTA
jgi:hypothetical protein